MPSKPMRRGTARRPRANTEQLRERVLEAFSATAKRHGFRALLMTKLASELRISATTLYKLFPSKEALALACVEDWVNEIGAAEAARRAVVTPRDGFEQYMQWVDAWAEANAALSPAFTRDLQTEYASVWKRYVQALDDRKHRGARLLRPLLKPGIDERVAFALLNVIFTKVREAEFAERLDISRREALRSAVAIWAGGALQRSQPATRKPQRSRPARKR
ncbi:MAG: TetR/AcrR family transcriptional regulator [Polyangiales bacterium]